MKKIFLRIVILLAVFVFAFIFFYNNIDEHSYSNSGTTVESHLARLPLVSFKVHDVEINMTKGYKVLMDTTYPRSSITPMSTAKEFSIIIDQKASTVKKLTYQVLDIPSLSEIEGGERYSFNETEDGRLISDILLEANLSTDTEYLFKITLTDALGSSIFYYTRIQIANYGSLVGSVEFAEKFHEATFDKTAIYDYEKMIETDEDLTNSNFAHVNIKDDLETVSYGSLAPKEIYRTIPTITEYNSEYASIALDFYITADIEEVTETFKCRENLRFIYGERKSTLYNYDRTMDKVFDGTSFMVDSKRFKLGITNEKDIEKYYSEDNKHLIFAYQGTLWHLDFAANKLYKVFTFSEDDLDRNIIPEYDYEILSVEKNGDCQFAVYGYIGKGAYEGRMGVLYYNYHAGNNRIEEMMFIPITADYSLLEGEFGKVSYVNEVDVFYFTMFDGYYSYELLTNSFRTEVADLGENWLYFKPEQLIVYNENRDLATNKSIQLLSVTSGEKYSIEAPEGKNISLLGTVDNRIVYGIGNPQYVSFSSDGKTFIPYDSIIIAELDGTIVKEYNAKDNTYVGDVDFSTGIISFKLYELVSKPFGKHKAVFEYIKDDVIVNLNSAEVATKNYTSNYSLLARTEYYMTLPSTYKVKDAPAIRECKSTVITKDTSVLVDYEAPKSYYVYAYGKVVDITNDLGKAIMGAYSNSGAVVRSDGTVVWRRGVVETSKELFGIKVYAINEERNKEQAVLQSLMAYKGLTDDASECNMAEKSILDWMKEKISTNADVVRNCGMRQILYFVSDGHPVIASYREHYIVIYRFTSEYVYFLEPLTSGEYAVEKDDFEKMVNDAGGVYYVY